MATSTSSSPSSEPPVHKPLTGRTKHNNVMSHKDMTSWQNQENSKLFRISQLNKKLNRIADTLASPGLVSDKLVQCTHNTDYVLQSQVSKKDKDNQKCTVHAYSGNGTYSVQNQVSDFSYKQLRFDALEVKTKIGLDCHIKAINEQYPDGFSLDNIYSYLKAQTQLKPQSLSTLSFGIKAAVKNYLGLNYVFDAHVKYTIDRFFKEFTCKRKDRSPKKFVTPETLKKFTEVAGLRTGMIAEFLFHTSIRVSEMCAIKKADIAPSDNCYSVEVVQKGRNKNIILLRKDLIDEAKLVFRGKVYLFETQKHNPYRRQDIATLLREQSEKHLGARITPHMLRHSYATYIATKHPDKLKGAVKNGGWKDYKVFYNTYVYQDHDPYIIPRLRDM